MNHKVTVSCSGKFHAFDLADQLQKHNMFHSLFTTYAYQKNTFWRKWVSRVDTEELPIERLHTSVAFAIGRKLWDKPFFWNTCFDLWVANQLKKDNDFDVFIGWSGMSSNSIKTAKALGKKTIVTRGSSHILTQNQILKEEYARFNIRFEIDKKVIKKELNEYELADYIAVPSEFAFQTFLEQGVPEKKLFLNSLAVETSFTDLSEKAALPPRPFRILYLGHMSPRKGIQYLFEAFERLQQEGLEVELWIVGGSTKEMAAYFQAHPLPQNAKIFGHIPRTELSNYINNCHLGILPSLEEGLAKVIPEMLIHGLPVIATFNSGGSDIIKDGENGFIIPIRSVEAIMEKILLLYHQPHLLSKMSSKAISSIRETHNWESYGNKYADFIASILGNPTQ